MSDRASSPLPLPLVSSPRKLRSRSRPILLRCFELLPAAVLALLLLKGTRQLFRFDQVSTAVVGTATTTTTTTVSQPIQIHDSSKWRFCDGATEERPCIFDLGMNKGQSSAFYLIDPATRVLAVEANPILVRKGTKRFYDYSTEGRFKLVHAGIAKTEGETLTFWVNTVNDKFSSFYQRVGCRSINGKWLDAGDLTNCRRIEVETATCADLVDIHGTPKYLKVDVEGMDKTCLRSLAKLDIGNRPQFVSKENVEPGDLDMLRELGYTKFKAVNQAVLEAKYENDESMRGTSGPWGDEAIDAFVGTRWQTYDELSNRMPLTKKSVVNGRMWKAWYDLHASK